MAPSPPSPTPLASIPRSVVPNRTNELVTYTPYHTATASNTSQGSGAYYGLIPNATQTIAPTNPNSHCLASASQASTSGNYQAGFSRFKEDLASMIKTKLGVDMGSSHVCTKNHLLKLILFLILLFGVFLSLLNLMVMILG